MPGRLLIRADADSAIGTGHVMRTLALAQAWQGRGGEAYYLKRQGPEGIDRRLAAEGFGRLTMEAEPGTAEDARLAADAARMLGARWIVADGYLFDADYQRRLRDGFRLLAVDDHGHAGEYAAHAVLNANISADAGLYARRAAGTRLLLGPAYAMIRREFTERASFGRAHPERARRLLVTMGGADPRGATGLVLDALALLADEELEVVCLVGPADPRAGALAARAAGLPGHVRIERDPGDVPGQMARADLAVSAAGSTCYELALMGLPALVVAVADNQHAIAAGLDRAGTAESLGAIEQATAGGVAGRLASLIADPARRAAMSAAGRKLVDGRGPGRVLDALAEIAGG